MHSDATSGRKNIHRQTTDRQTGRQAGRHADRQIDREANRQAYRQTDRQAGRPASRQTDRFSELKKQWTRAGRGRVGAASMAIRLPDARVQLAKRSDRGHLKY